MNHSVEDISNKHFRKKFADLNEREKHVTHHLAERTHIARNIVQDILNLHEKIDTLREKQWGDLTALQQEQLALLTQVMNNAKHTP